MTSPAPTAVHPGRVLILDEHEQATILDGLDLVVIDGVDSIARRLWGRIAYGDEYDNPVDELVRTTLRKRKLEAAVRACNQRIEALNEIVVEELAERGDIAGTHAATGANYRLDSKIWAKLDIDTNDLPNDEAAEVRAEFKGRAGQALIDAGLDGYVRPDFNLNSISAYFREEIKAYRAEQFALPEHERVPRPVESFLPPELVGFIHLDDTPTISVRAS